MWIKLITQPSPKLTVQAVPQKSGEPVTGGATHAIAATGGHHSPAPSPVPWPGAASAQVSVSAFPVTAHSLQNFWAVRGYYSASTPFFVKQPLHSPLC